ncbi:MAG: hypothetical protein HY721_27685 [Planctomycetes bacterium]|nr:hypothetical protein [Planctomycetota bacterium]
MPERRSVLQLLSRRPGGKKRAWRKRLSRGLAYAAGRGLEAFLSRLPLKVGRAVALAFGTGAYLLLRNARRTATANLTSAFGSHLTPGQIRALARRVFQHHAVVYADWLILRRWPLERLEAAFPDVSRAIRALEAEVKATGSGVVGLTAHLGNWELLALLCSRFAPGLLVPMARKLRFARSQERLHRLRTSAGLEIVYTDESPRRVIRAVRQGRLLGILPDQDVRTNSAMFVDFFGRAAYTATFPVQLSRDLGVKMTFVVLVREGAGYRFVNRGLFDVPGTGDEGADLRAGTALWSHILEDEIRARPEQWAWMYDRWRTTPERPRRHLDRGGRIG